MQLCICGVRPWIQSRMVINEGGYETKSHVSQSRRGACAPSIPSPLFRVPYYFQRLKRDANNLVQKTARVKLRITISRSIVGVLLYIYGVLLYI
jgi:hypothetical protein